MRVVFMGSPEFAVPPLEQLVLNQYQVVAVYTQPDRTGREGANLSFSPGEVGGASPWGLRWCSHQV